MRRLGHVLTFGAIGALLAAPAAAASPDEAPILTKTKAQCAAEYNANIKAIKANGQSKAAFDADCRAGTEKIGPKPTATAAAPKPAATAAAPKPAATPAPAAPAVRTGD